MENYKVEIEVKVDFDGYFENLTKTMLQEANNPEIKKAIVSAAPYEGYAVDIEPVEGEPNTLSFHYHSGWIDGGFRLLPYIEIINDLKNWKPETNDNN